MDIEREYQVDFLLVTITKGVFFTPHRPEGLEFVPTTQSGLRFDLAPSDPVGDACGNRKGLECKLYFSHRVTKQQSDFVSSYNDQKTLLRVAEDVTLPYKFQEETLINESGRCKDGFSPRRYLCPSDIRELIKDVESELSTQTEKFLKLLRWRQGIDARGDIVESRSLYWRVGEGVYYLVPLNGGPTNSIVVPMMFGLHWNDDDSKDLQKLWALNDIAEPLGHALVREATAIAPESPRSAMLIVAAALETAVKMHISSIASDADWLMEEVPSPPVSKMLRYYIPLIHLKRGNELTYWGQVRPFIKKVEKLFTDRNKVAHTGKIPEGAMPIHESIELVSDLLYLLDVLSGHDWAKSLPSFEFRKALHWPDSVHSKSEIEITIPY